MFMLQSDLRSAIQIAATYCYFNPNRYDSPSSRPVSVRTPSRLKPLHAAAVERVAEKPPICTADELHYVSIHNSDWRLALWRYKPPPQAPSRNHPLLLLSGIGTNAIGYDLAPGSSFARHMSSQGFDTWILEFRGAGLSSEVASKEVKQPVSLPPERLDATSKNPPNVISDSSAQSEVSSAGEKKETVESDSDQSQLLTTFTETFKRFSERLTNLIKEGSPEALQNSTLATQIRDLSQRLVDIMEEGQRSVSPPITDLLDRFSSTVENLQSQIDLLGKYNWDFDHYLEEDVPAAMEYILRQCNPKDDKLLAIGHSMGGILLYSMLSRNAYEQRDSRLAAIVTLGASLDYTTSNSTLKLLTPLADPAQALNVPAVPLGALLAAAYPLASRPPYVMSWLNRLITAQDMMHPDLMEKFVMTNFCTVPAKLLLQLTTAFQVGGLRDRSGTFFYKNHINKIDVPVLAIAGDLDLICPPEAVYETIKLVPKHLAKYKVFGEPGGPHYAHYDLVGGRLAPEQLYPCVIEFLTAHDST
ncbi:putative alpha/beta hydrolase-1, peptidase S9, serine active [Helianthus annuus]|nr:putative alpha/beta hydrolase-1, peptidase S9, serine active [Helianthus annuus]KAJ0633238.1 putative alpha/beta hydrolase-1, peptidase S9, serine active [Helianthus annuus]KAJ0827307.1 putative alpha/beta hydrolase-1, peptidase S9, serine active [Helianthus annuus]